MRHTWGCLAAAAAVAFAPRTAFAEPMRMGDNGEYVMGEEPANADGSTRAGPLLMPIRTMVPGTWGTPGTWSAMGNAALVLTNPGFPRAYDAGLGETHPYLLADWVMVRGRTSDGVWEGMLMLNFEALTFTRDGWYEVGQAGEGLWDRQHQHQLLHQALLAVHLMGKEKSGFLATLWGGQGSAPIGPPIFMHRTSTPSHAVPRKHHKGENPHETLPVLGATLEIGGTALDFAVFSARDLHPSDVRYYPRFDAPTSYAARLRQSMGGTYEAQISALRLADTGAHDGTQLSASIYGRAVEKRYVLDALLDFAVDVPDAGTSGEELEPYGAPFPITAQSFAHGQHGTNNAAAALAEVALRDATLRDMGWARVEMNQRREPGGAVTGPWMFTTLGYERLVWVAPESTFGLGLFAEATHVIVPRALEGLYGDRTGVTTTVGMMGHFMFMPEHLGHGSGHHH